MIPSLDGQQTMDLRQLRSFVHVAEIGSISAAAERLNTAQSALSRQIRSLENDLGATLFTRHGRGVVLTDRGRALLSRSTTILHEVDRVREEMHEHSDLCGGQVVVGVPPTVADVLSGPLADQFLAKYPRVKLRISSSYSGYILDWLQRGIVDVGIIYENRDERSIRAHPLLLEKLLAVGRPDSGLQRDRGVPFSGFRTERMILPSRQHGLRILLDTLAANCGFDLAPVVETDSLHAQIDLVRRGHGITVLPLVSVFDEVKAGRLVAAPIVEPEVSRRLMLALPAERPISLAASRLEALISSVVQKLVRSRQWDGIFLDEPHALSHA